MKFSITPSARVPFLSFPLLSKKKTSTTVISKFPPPPQFIFPPVLVFLPGGEGGGFVGIEFFGIGKERGGGFFMASGLRPRHDSPVGGMVIPFRHYSTHSYRFPREETPGGGGGV